VRLTEDCSDLVMLAAAGWMPRPAMWGSQPSRTSMPYHRFEQQRVAAGAELGVLLLGVDRVDGRLDRGVGMDESNT